MFNRIKNALFGESADLKQAREILEYFENEVLNNEAMADNFKKQSLACSQDEWETLIPIRCLHICAAKQEH